MTVRDFVVRLLLDRTQARQGIADTRDELRAVGAASARAADDAREVLDDAAQDGRRAGRDVASGARDAAEALRREGDAGKQAGDKIAAGAENATGKTEKLKSTIAATIAAAGGMAAIFAYIGNTASLDRTAESLGLSVERLQMWQGAAQAAGGDAEEIADRFRDLNDYITDATKFDSGPLKEIAQEIGVSLTDATGQARNAEDVMLDLADAFQRVGEQEAVGYGMQLSFDPATIGLLQQGRGELEALLNRQRELGILTKRDTEAATRARQAFVDAIKAATYIIGTTLTPVLEILSDWLSRAARWAVEHRDFLRVLFIVAATAITAVLIPALSGLATAGFSALAPFLPLIAAVGLLSLSVNDLLAFLDGGNSILGEFLTWLGLSEQQIEAVRTVLKTLGGILSDVLDLVTSFFSRDGARLADAFQRITDKISGLKQIFSSMLDSIKTKLVNLLPDWIRDLLTEDDTETPSQAQEVAGAQQAVAMQGAAMAGAPGLSTQDNRKTVTATTTVQSVTINTQATDSKEIAENFGTELGAVMQQEYAIW